MQIFFHQYIARMLVGLFTMGVLLLSPGASGAADTLSKAGSAVSCPSVTLQNWKDSTKQEKLAFLLGFATMLEIEKEWQGEAPLPIEQSINGSWVRGLTGQTLDQLAAALDLYVTEHPDQQDRNVVSVLGALYVRPALTPQEKERAAAHYRQIKK